MEHKSIIDAVVDIIIIISVSVVMTSAVAIIFKYFSN